MNTLLNLFSYTLLYYQLDNVLKPCLYDNFEIFQEEPVQFYPIMQAANIFILSIFSLFTSYLLLFSKIKNYTIYSLAFIYMKYVMDTIIHNNAISIYQYEFRRTVMWLFTTPLIIILYCDMNHLTLRDVNAQYHILSNAVHILLYSFRKTSYNYYIIGGLSISEGYFIYKLCYLSQYKYTKFIIYIWCLFSFITVIELCNIFNIHDIQICYLLSDMIAKLTTMLIVNDFEEQTYFIKHNIDLQSVSVLSSIQKSIKQFEATNQNITVKCKMFIQILETHFKGFIPIDKTLLKLELLKKILPMELEDRYLIQSKDYKQYNFICVLFVDIVSYTELAKAYDADIIYKLLNDIYTIFDTIVIRYGNLQKIETIGDAYMVVGDIYTNDTDNNVKNIILLAFDLMNAIKTIPAPNKKRLELRIGINIGKVVVGILGTEIPRLCVIGNTVNVANRLQTGADPNTIQISHHVYELAVNIDFGKEVLFEKKEQVYLKNIGITTTYVITPPDDKNINNSESVNEIRELFDEK